MSFVFVEALSAVVSDINNNPVANTPVIYTITQGDAEFDLQSALGAELLNNGQSIRTLTDNKGQSSARPRMGTTKSNVKIIAQAELEDNTTIGQTTFNIIVLKRSDQATRFSGTVMDHTGVPIQGIQFSIARTNLTALSDENGRFRFPNNVPTGKIDLFVDGRNVQAIQNGETIQYPALHFETAIIQGQNNQLPHPVYLPPVHIENTKTVGGNQDVTLTIPGFEGFKMIVKANSVTFPDGSTEGELVVSPVHNDRLPMVPPGTGGRFMATGWTLQPTGTRFDPPIEVHIPNTDGLKPGTTVPIVQWDHDMAYFVPMGQGTISEDGTTLISNPGSGITKAGWGGGVNPITPNDANDGCEVTIFANNEEDVLWELYRKDGVEVSFSAGFKGNGCGQREYVWKFGDGEPDSNNSAPTHNYTEDGKYSVSLIATCAICNPFEVSDGIEINIFLPFVEIKNDEEHENGTFELISVNDDQYYAERTNLIIEVKYPSAHPKKAGKVIEDYSGEIKIKEDSGTNYYNGEDEASELPKNINISEGIGKISIDSVSNMVEEPDNIEDVPEKAKLNSEFEDLPSLENDSTKDFEIEQWVKDSDLDVSLNLSGSNDPEMPDWLEKSSWDKINNYKSQGGLISQIAGLVKEIKMFYISPLDPNPPSTIGETCGVTPLLLGNGQPNLPNIGAGGNIFISPFCATIGHRRNVSNSLNNTIIHEARHLFQFVIMFNIYPNSTGNGIDNAPLNDSDLDTCPEIIPLEVEGSIIDDQQSPFQEGVSVLIRGIRYTSTNDGNPDTSECLELNEFDAETYGDQHGN